MSLISSLSEAQLQDKVNFIENYKQAFNPADGSTVDANANVTLKNISTLETELMKAKMLSMKQEVTLSEMQNSLTELKGQIDNDKRTIKRLRVQRNLSQVVGAGAIIGVVIRR